MRSRLARTASALLFVIIAASPATAAPSTDSPIGNVGRAIARIVRHFQHLLIPTPNDEPSSPKP